QESGPSPERSMLLRADFRRLPWPGASRLMERVPGNASCIACFYRKVSHDDLHQDGLLVSPDGQSQCLKAPQFELHIVGENGMALDTDIECGFGTMVNDIG